MLLPFIVIMFRRATNIPAHSALLPTVPSLIGAVIMAGSLSLKFFDSTRMNGALELALQMTAGITIYFSYLYCFARGELRPLLSAILSRGH
jgi:hypothetical protein